MLKALYEAIRGDAAPTIINVAGRNYSNKTLLPVKTPKPDTIKVSTLTGIVDYLNSHMDMPDVSGVFCHVVSPTSVAILSNIWASFADRAEYIRATLDQMELPFNKWMDAEPFNIALQSCFVDMAGDDELAGVKDTDKATVLAYISNVRAISEAATMDDGATQSVEVKTGIASKAVKALPNPVILRPYRTFTEV